MQNAPTSTPATDTQDPMANPYLIAAIPGVLSGLSGWLSGKSNKQAQQQQAAQELAQRQRELALQATQMDQLKQQRSRQLNALVASLLQNSTTPSMDSPGSGLKYNYGDFASFFTPEARANAERQFMTTANEASGGRYAGSGDVGYGAPMTIPAMASTTPASMMAPAPKRSKTSKFFGTVGKVLKTTTPLLPIGGSIADLLRKRSASNRVFPQPYEG